MSVTTTADNILDQVDRDIKSIIDQLNPIVLQNENVWGSRDYSAEYHAKIVRGFVALIQLRSDLNRWN